MVYKKNYKLIQFFQLNIVVKSQIIHYWVNIQVNI